MLLFRYKVERYLIQTVGSSSVECPFWKGKVGGSIPSRQIISLYWDINLRSINKLFVAHWQSVLFGKGK